MMEACFYVLVLINCFAKKEVPVSEEGTSF